MDSPQTSGVSQASGLARGGVCGVPAEGAGKLARRLRGGGVSAGCWAALAIAAWLSPHAGGTGTHQELGLPACGFLVWSGLPCPTCGLTTSVSAMAHGRVALAWRAQPFGAVLFVALAVLALAGTVEALTARDVLSRLRPGWLLWAVLIGIPAGWVLKLIVGLTDGTLPMR
jgi:hypothetical protein